MKYEIAGARATIEDPEATLKRAQAIAAEHRSEVLLADARVVFGRDHLESAVQQALRAHTAGSMVARSVSMESLRYLSAQRQVADAIRVGGIRRGTKETAIVSFGPLEMDVFLVAFGWERHDSVLDAGGKSLELFGITDVESATVPAGRRADLVLEKVALLGLEK